MKRKHFLQSVLGASAFLGLPFTAFGKDSTTIQELINNTKRDVLEKGKCFGDYEGSLIIKRSLIPLFPCKPPVCIARIELPLGK